MNNRQATSVFLSGTSIAQFPSGGSLAGFYFNDQTEDILYGKSKKSLVPVLGLYPTTPESLVNETNSHGRIAVFGDSSCLDDAPQQDPRCFWVLKELLSYINTGEISQLLPVDKPLSRPFKSDMAYPQRLEGNDLHKYSKVIDRTATCKHRDFRRYNSSIEIPAIVWEMNTKPFQGSSTGRFREGTMNRKDLQDQQQGTTVSGMNSHVQQT